MTDEAVLAKAYRAANVTIVASRAGNFPYVGLESLACSTPLLVFRVGRLVEMIEKYERGVLTRAFNLNEMGDARSTAAGRLGMHGKSRRRCERTGGTALRLSPLYVRILAAGK